MRNVTVHMIIVDMKRQQNLTSAKAAEVRLSSDQFDHLINNGYKIIYTYVANKTRLIITVDYRNVSS